MPFRLATALLIAVVVAGCAARPTMPVPAPAPPAAGDFSDQWAAYLATLAGVSLQPDCRPRVTESLPGVAYRGTVLLLHGYSACPQQFFQLAGQLAAEGYRVVMPLLPGHGRAPPEADGDDFRDLPVAGNWEAIYDEFAARMNGLMASAPGQRVIGGLSVGGAASLYLANRAPGLYDRMIVLAPFFAPGGGAAAGSAVAVATRTPGVNAAPVKPFGIKQPCLDKRAQGRAGFCNYELRHVGALTAMGSSLLAEIGAAPIATRLQFVGVENDPVVNNARSRDFLARQQAMAGTSACFMPDGVPHAMISAYDSPGLDTWWLEPLTTGIIRFVAGGESFPAEDAPSAAEAPWPRCRVPAVRPSETS